MTTVNVGDAPQIEPKGFYKKEKLGKKKKKALKLAINKQNIIRRKNLEESSYNKVRVKFDTLKKNKVALSNKEKDIIKDKKAVCSNSDLAVWKSVVDGMSRTLTEHLMW